MLVGYVIIATVSVEQLWRCENHMTPLGARSLTTASAKFRGVTLKPGFPNCNSLGEIFIKTLRRESENTYQKLTGKLEVLQLLRSESGNNSPRRNHILGDGLEDRWEYSHVVKGSSIVNGILYNGYRISSG